jgi:anti-sigma regulatory factor (Ser/Thr protein kinase)
VGSAVEERTPSGGYRHEALIYSGRSDFLDSTLEFIVDGVRAGEPTMVVLDEDKIDSITRALGADARNVSFADMADIGANPARIIAAWHRFRTDHSGQAIRGIGEPIHAERSAAELVECQLHEALLNLAFEDRGDFWLLCPYDLDSLSDDVLVEAFRTHPYIANGADRRSSALYEQPSLAGLFGRDLGAAPADARQLTFGRSDLSALRQFVSGFALELRFHSAQVGEVVMAVNELATNAVEHGGGTGRVGLWNDSEVLHFEVTDAGLFTEPLAGRIPPVPSRVDGRGLWIANQLCDLLQIRSYPSGTVVRGQVRRIGPSN